MTNTKRGQNPIPRPPRPRATLTPVAFAQGSMLLTVAVTYLTIADTLYELVQNALDAEATRVEVEIHTGPRNITVRDNGTGVTADEFNESLLTIGLSSKEVGKLGRFGRGSVSPIGKCEVYRFTSRSKGPDAVFNEWSFVSANLAEMVKRITVPRIPRSDLSSIKPRLWWSTEGYLEHYTDDKVISRIKLEKLEQELQERFSETMRRLKTVVRIRIVDPSGDELVREVRSRQFSGQPLPEDTHNNVVFRIYLSNSSARGRRGGILMGEHGDDYRFPFNAFLSNAHDLLDAEVKDALRSGVFNGEILGKQVRLHSGRRAFVQDDALVEFCIGVTEWFNKIGRRYYAEAKDKKREERWQTTGLKALDALHAMLKLQDYAYLRNVLDTFSFGSHGAGHAPTGTTPSGQKADKVIAKGSGKGSGKGSHPSEPPAKDNPNHKPFTVAGPRGSQRRRVAHDSLGLTITFYGRDSDDLWDLDLREGTLNFNERHPHFRACEKREWQLHRLIHFVVIQALTLETLPNDNGLMRLAYNELIGPYVFMITNGPELANASAKDQSA